MCTAVSEEGNSSMHAAHRHDAHTHTRRQWFVFDVRAGRNVEVEGAW